MKRLQAVITLIDDEEFVGGFVSPCGIAEWRRFLARIRPVQNPEFRMHQRVRANLGHRFQLLEFECALLLLDRESKILKGGRSTLHETVSRMKIHQYCVLAHSILEGLGSHFTRANLVHRSRPVNENQKVATNVWIPALAAEVLRCPSPPALPKATLKADIKAITDIRDRVHLDTVDPNYELDFNNISYTGSFVPTYNTFKTILTTLNPAWPDCCLNEEVE